MDQVYDSQINAAESYRETIITKLIEDECYLVRILCENCKLKGTVYLAKDVVAEGSYCPQCNVAGIKVTGKGDTKNIVFTPSIGPETSEKVEALVESYVTEGISNGKIKRDGLFR